MVADALLWFTSEQQHRTLMDELELDHKGYLLLALCRKTGE